MRGFLTNTLVFFTFTLFSCFDKRRELDTEKCLPAIILIGYLGESNKPVYPLIIRTRESDTTYMEFIGFENEKFQRTGILTSREYLRITTISAQQYNQLKNYVVVNNPQSEQTIFNANANTLKLILVDKCDSITYTVDNTVNGYFSNMIEMLNLNKKDSVLKGYLKYYQEIQEWEHIH
jgi:hypothetical protein